METKIGRGTNNVHDQMVYALSLILRDRREALDVSQSDLARKSGLHRSYIGDLERGSRNISVRNLSRIAFALEVSASKLLGLAEKRLATAGPFKLKKRSSEKSAAKVKASTRQAIKKVVKSAATKASKSAEGANGKASSRTIKSLEGKSAGKDGKVSLKAKKSVDANVAGKVRKS